MICKCRYCTAQNIERRSLKRRRNPDDLEELEKISRARKIYRDQEIKNISAVARAVNASTTKVSQWVADLRPKTSRKRGSGGFLKKLQVDTTLDFIKNEGGCIKTSNLKDKFNVPHSTALKWLNRLSKKKILLKVGAAGVRRRYCLPGYDDPEQELINQVNELLKQGMLLQPIATLLSKNSPHGMYAHLRRLRKDKKLIDLNQLFPNWKDELSYLVKLLGATKSSVARDIGKPLSTLGRYTDGIIKQGKKVKPDLITRKKIHQLYSLAKTEGLEPKIDKEVLIQRAKDLYKTHKSTTKVAEIMNIPVPTIWGWVKNLTKEKTKLRNLKKARARFYYIQTGNVSEAARLAGLNWETAARAVADMRKTKKRKTPAERKAFCEKVIKLFKKHKSTTKVAEILGESRQVIYRCVKHIIKSNPLRYINCGKCGKLRRGRWKFRARGLRRYNSDVYEDDYDRPGFRWDVIPN